jgi:hypothetical protein
MNKPLAINLDAKRTTIMLTAIMSALLAIHVLAMQANFNESLGWKKAWDFEYWQVAIFDLDEEESFGTWFSTTILLFASVLSLLVAASLRSAADNMHRWWTTLGLGFGLLSIDEVVGLHELFNTLYEDVPWTTAGFSLFVLAGFCFLPFLWHYRWRTSSLFVVAGIVYASGAIGIERYSGTDINSLGYNMLTALEEGLEMFGVIIVIYALLDFIRGIESAK